MGWLGLAAAAIIAVGVSLLGVSLASGGSRSPSAGRGSGGGGGSSTPGATSRLAATGAVPVTIRPASGSTNVAPDQPVTVSVPAGRIESVQVTPTSRSAVTASQPVSGSLATDGRSWQSTTALAPSTTYRVTATVRAQTGTQSASATFTTLTPTGLVTVSISPAQGEVVGVGEPISFVFSRPITSAQARATLLSHLAVAMTQVVPGGWAWLSDTELHFKPTNYWPTGEQVAVGADLNGWDVGDGVWGSGLHTERFLVGPANVSVVDLANHKMWVTSDGQTKWTFPVSAGSDQYPTMDGIHIALDKETVVHMVSSTVGIPVDSPSGYDEYVYWDVHISDSGEYVHAAPWSVSDQGNTNVSHGCVNLSPTNAELFYGFSQPGDVIDVINGTRPPDLGDHGVMDWTSPASSWTPATVGTLAPVPVASFVNASR